MANSLVMVSLHTANENRRASCQIKREEPAGKLWGEELEVGMGAVDREAIDAVAVFLQ